jgi:alpha-galactosidase
MKMFNSKNMLRGLGFLGLLVLTQGIQLGFGLNNGLGLTPPMGWNPWNSIGRWTTLQDYKEMIDIMGKNGMREAGYNYIVADGGPFMYGPDSGLKEFIDYAHNNGFKAGLYYGHRNTNPESTVTSWAKLGFDYLKHDSYDSLWSNPVYYRMRNALLNCGRPVYYSIHPKDLAPKPDTLCNAQRVDNDILWKIDTLFWDTTKSNGSGVMGEVKASRRRESLAKPGFYNDMDMMGVGMPITLTLTQAKTHFAFWCIMTSLLIEGSDLRKISKERLDILLNRELIAVNQDSLGDQGKVVATQFKGGDSVEVISKKMKDGSRAVMLFNRNGATKDITFKVADIGLSGKVYARDLWTHTNLPEATESITMPNIPKHGCAMLRISTSPILTGINKIPVFNSLVASRTFLFHSETTAFLKHSAHQVGVKIFNLQGMLLWENTFRESDREKTIRLPLNLKHIGVLVAKFH